MTESTMSKQEREREELVQALAKKGNQRPPSSDVDKLLAEGKAEPAAAPTPHKLPHKPSVVPPPKVLEAHKTKKPAAAAPAEAPPPPETPPPQQEPAAPAAVPAPVEAPAPWACAHPKVTSPYLLRLPEELHMKLSWLADHLPSTSMNKLMLAAVQTHAEALLAEHYKPEVTK